MSIKIFLDSSLGDVYEKDFRYNNDYAFGGGNPRYGSCNGNYPRK